MVKYLRISSCIRSSSTYLTLQPIPSEFPYISGKFRFRFYQCGPIQNALVQIFSCSLFSFDLFSRDLVISNVFISNLSSWNLDQFRWLDTIETIETIFPWSYSIFRKNKIHRNRITPQEGGLISCDAISTVADKVAWNSSEHFIKAEQYVCFCLFYVMLSLCCSLVESTIPWQVGGHLCQVSPFQNF